ncbi:murein hydrolase activator EnvC family protein [Arthrobacter sp. CAN_A1]|uniref:murein hydrolase activator EnvC family protein n=1 Tax=Arthrobacter sp. CAN_A1 TaxID=2787717 RepID=UPI001A2F5A8C
MASASLVLATGFAGGGAGRTGPGIAAEPSWTWPLSPTPRVLRHFEPPAQRWLPGHRGVDLAATGTVDIRSPAQGRVVFTGWVVDRPVVTVDHGGGLISSFEPVVAGLKRGDLVQAGQPVGTLAPEPQASEPGVPGSHCSSTCLHWGVRRDGDYVNPLDFVLDRRPSILLPLHGP